MEEMETRGRRPKFSRTTREYFAHLIREHGVRGAKRESSIPVCQQTPSKIASEFGIALKKGKRPRRTTDREDAAAN